MTLKTACEIAKDCNLETIMEACNNINVHAQMLFEYSKIDEEMTELGNEAVPLLEQDPNMTIQEYFESLR